jgi:hypothetical protein
MHKAYAGSTARFPASAGCPMAGGELAGNLPTDKILKFVEEKGLETGISAESIRKLEVSFRQLINS